MTKQEKLGPLCAPKHQSWPLAVLLAAALSGFMTADTAKAFPGDQWILPITQRNNSGAWLAAPGAGYNGTTAYEAIGPDPTTRIYWALTGLSTVNNSPFPITTELYTIEWFQPTSGGEDWQPIEGNLRGNPDIAGSDGLMDSIVPWAGEYGQNHQWIGAQGTDGTPGNWTTTGPGPHTPESADYNALGDNGLYMWLKAGAYLYAKWDFSFTIDHTWSALRVTQVTATRPVIQSISRSGNTVTLTWSAGGGGNYQVQYKTNLSQVGWSNLGGLIPAVNLTTSTTDVNPPDAARFYRVQVLP